MDGQYEEVEINLERCRKKSIHIGTHRFYRSKSAKHAGRSGA